MESSDVRLFVSDSAAWRRDALAPCWRCRHFPHEEFRHESSTLVRRVYSVFSACRRGRDYPSFRKRRAARGRGRQPQRLFQLRQRMFRLSKNLRLVRGALRGADVRGPKGPSRDLGQLPGLRRSVRGCLANRGAKRPLCGGSLPRLRRCVQAMRRAVRAILEGRDDARLRSGVPKVPAGVRADAKKWARARQQADG